MTRGILLVTCEHGGNRIPAPYRSRFRYARRLLASHRGYDPGALAMAKALAGCLGGLLVAATVSRLLVDLNRSLGHPRLFSEITRPLPAQLRAAVVEQHYVPHRLEVERQVERALARGRRVVHIASHSFTPELDGQVRRADVGLLYDPARRSEATLCAEWKAAIRSRDPSLTVRRNYPYAGRADGLTTHLRRRFAVDAYVGVELEVNQRFVFAAGRRWARLANTLGESLRAACAAEGVPLAPGVRRSAGGSGARSKPAGSTSPGRAQEGSH
jgi:predicted N-formylglutamate amidohydrolase